MVKFIPVAPKDIPTTREGRRGRVSYPLLKSFLEANIRCAKLDLTGLGKNPAYLRSVLYSYIRNHKLPIRIFASSGDMYMLRLDMDDEGNVDPKWSYEEHEASDGHSGTLRNMPSVPITPDEVDRRFQKERKQATK